MARSIPIRPDDDIMDADVVVRSILEGNVSAKPAEGFRSYGEGVDSEGAGDSGGGAPERVLAHYRDMRTYQTVEFYDRMATKYSFDDGKHRDAPLPSQPCWKSQMVLSTAHPEPWNPVS